MKSEEIIQRTLEIYSGDKNHVAKYLKHYISTDSKYEFLHNELVDRLNIPILATGGISESNLQSLRSNQFLDEDIMFDSSDYYQFVLNREIDRVDDWEFTERIEAGQIISSCRLFVNNCLTIYHLHVQLIGNDFDKHPPSYGYNLRDIKIINRIRTILHNKDFVQCPNEILNNRYQELTTDLVEYNASIYECLFSDFHLLYSDSESKIVLI